GACLVKSLFGLPSWTVVAALIAEHPGLQAAIGGNPSVWAMYRFTRKLQAWAFVLAAIGRLAPLVTPRRLARFWSGLPVKDALQRGDHIDCASEARLITELTEAAERQMARIRRGLGQSLA